MKFYSFSYLLGILEFPNFSINRNTGVIYAKITLKKCYMDNLDFENNAILNELKPNSLKDKKKLTHSFDTNILSNMGTKGLKGGIKK